MNLFYYSLIVVFVKVILNNLNYNKRALQQYHPGPPYPSVTLIINLWIFKR